MGFLVTSVHNFIERKTSEQWTPRTARERNNTTQHSREEEPLKYTKRERNRALWAELIFSLYFAVVGSLSLSSAQNSPNSKPREEEEEEEEEE